MTTTINADAMSSLAPLWFHVGDSISLKRHISDIECTIVFVGYHGNVCVCAASLMGKDIRLLDAGILVEYSLYAQHGIRAFSDLGFDGASRFTVYRDPVVSDLGSVLGDLLAAPRPNSLCTRKLVRSQGNVYVPDYVRILGELHVDTAIDP